MQKPLVLSALTLTLILAACGAPQQAQLPETARTSPDLLAPLLTADEPIPGQYVVVLHDGAENDTISAQNAGGLIKSLNLDPQGVTVKHMYGTALNGFAAKLSAQNLQTLRADPRVKYVQQDGRAYVTATQTSAPWGIDRLDQRNLPLNNTYNYTSTGAGVTAYIIDTGIRTTHQDFGGRATMGINTTGDGKNTDCHFHGTMVASLTGGKTYGVAKAVNLVGVKVMGCNGGGDWSNIIAGVNWVANKTGPRTANMSISGGAYQALDDTVNNAVAKGVVMVIASGNDNKDACQNSPARAKNAITVNATTNTDARWSYSNYGSCTDMFAPGAALNGATNTSDTATTNQSGTSLAAPHVTGAAALILSTNPTFTPAQVEAKLYADSTLGKVTNPGTGSQNRLLFIPATATPTNTAPVANFTSSVSGLSVSFSSTSTDAENNISTYTWNFGDGTTATGATASKTYAAAGTYTVTLTVTDAGGLSSTTSQSVTVTGTTNPGNTAPVANFTSSVSGLTASFTNSSTDAENNITGYTWNFGDGTTSTATNPSKTYAATGTYTVTLTATDAGGLSSTSSKQVTVSGGTTPTPGNETFTGTISTSGSYNFHTSSTGFYYAGGTIRGSLSHATGRDFDLYLQKKNADGTWTYVIKAATTSNPEVGSYTGTAGTYRWIVNSYSGTGSYTLTVTK